MFVTYKIKEITVYDITCNCQFVNFSVKILLPLGKYYTINLCNNMILLTLLLTYLYILLIKYININNLIYAIFF